MNLQEILYSYTNDSLKQLAKLCAGGSKVTRKDDLVRFLCDELLLPAHLRQHWAELDDLAQKAVAAAFHNEGVFDSEAFVAQYGSLPPRPKAISYYRPTPIPLDLFLYQGRIPSDMMPLLADFAPPPERFQVTGLSTAPTTIDVYDNPTPLIHTDTEESGRHDLLIFLRLVDQGALKFSSTTGRLTPASLPKLMENLLHGDFLDQEGDVDRKESMRPLALEVFAQEAGLVRTDRSRAGLTATGKTYLNTQDPQVLLEGFERWTNEGTFDELTRLSELRGLRTRGLKLSKPAARRAAIIEALSWCPTNVWISIGDFYRALRVWHFAVPVEESGYGSLYFGYRYQYEPWTDSQSYWFLIQGLYTNVVLWEFLGSIGALDLLYLPAEEAEMPVKTYYFDDTRYSRYDGLAYFRINPLGAFLFGQADSYSRAQVVRSALFQVSETLTLTLRDPDQITPNQLRQVEEIAIPAGAATYQLDTECLLTTLEQGGDPAVIADFLAEHNDGPLPATVDNWLEQTVANSKMISISKAIFVKLRSAAVLGELLADATISKIATRIDAKTLAIAASKEGVLRNRVKKLGYGVHQ